jgi:aminopeptidase N
VRGRPGRVRGLGGAAAAALLAAGCSASGSTPTSPEPPQAPGASASQEGPDGLAGLDAALSTPAEDSLYPDVGDPGVDALRYSLDLDWDPTTDTLTGAQSLVFRAAETDESFQLDLGSPLEVTALSLDGVPVEHSRDGKDLVVEAPVVLDRRYELEISYRGTPEPVPAPSVREDMATLGFTIDAEHEVWTMQEPYGAFTWYAANDHPSDKAFYDFTLSTPSPWTGIANGLQTSSTDDGATTTTTYELDEPAASYLVTVAFGDYERTDDVGPRGLPITYWVPRGREDVLPGLRTTPAALRFLERHLGPYPFATAGIVVVDSDSGMETQTMITLGDQPYSTSPAVVVHELAHQWWGDQVTPADWRDVWMNEGMAMYLQIIWQAEQEGTPLEVYLERYRVPEAEQRALAGPPGAFDPEQFGASNVYYGPALMWHALRERVGDEALLAVMRGWPLAQDGSSTDRDTLLAFVEKQTGEDLDDFFDAWLLGERTPR